MKMMKYERFTWRAEKLQHLDDEVIMVVDNANKEWKGHILNIVDMLNELNDEWMMYKTTIDKRIAELEEENEQLKQELQGMDELLQSYRKTIKHDAELLADASKNGYLPPLNDFVSADGWNCGCCKHFYSGVRDRCDKDNNWVLNDGYCQDFER